MVTKRGGRAASQGDGTFERTNTQQETARKQRARRGLIGALAVVLAAAGTGTGLYLTSASGPAPQPPCVACVSDGSRVFPGAGPAMRAMLAAIAKENASVRAARKTRPYVSIMLLNPLTPGAGSDVSPARMVDELRGAYLAQVKMNTSHTIGIQLLLDDEGTSLEGTEGPAVRQLMTMEGAPDRVVAVAGLGVSTAQTAAAARTLSGNRMPMFGAVTSANEFNGDKFRGMDQAVPDVAAQVALLARRLTVPHGAVLVYDQQASDYYTSDLRTGFAQAFARNLASVQQPYTPGVSDTNIEFKQIADEVCYTDGPPPYVFYAGRVSVMTDLIQQFQTDLHCSGKKISIVTAGDADGLDPAYTATDTPGQGQVSVIYTDIVDLNNLTPAFKQFYEHTLATLDPGHTGLSDTWTVATYNAMMSAWAAIQPAYEAVQPNLPTKIGVLDLVNRLNGEAAPSGATGSLALGADGKLLSSDIPIFEDTGGQRTTFTG
jgi:hypothetical protein